MNLLNPWSENLNAALEYGRRDWFVFPCHHMSDGGCSCCKGDCNSPAQHPRIGGWPKFATTNIGQIEAWWGQEPEANIGIATGPKTGAWVLDLDGPVGIASLEELVVEHGPIPPTPTVATGGGGRHLYFAYPTDREVRNMQIFVKPSIHVRGDGGYVIAPPSNHRSGNMYKWELSPEDVPLADAPGRLLDLVTDQGPRPSVTIDDDFADMTGGLDLRTDPGAQEGERHNRACKLVGAHLGRGEDPIVVMRLIIDWADRCNPPMNRNEVERIVLDFARKDAKRDSSKILNPNPWPNLGDAAYHGLAGEIVKAIEPQSESDPVAILGQLLVVFGNISGRNAYQRVEATNHYANLSLVLVGETAKARKGTSADRIRL